MTDIRPWYRWHWFKYRNSVRVMTMSLAAQGAYKNLLDSQWMLGGKLPNNREALWRLALALTRKEYMQVADEVESMFTVSECGKFLSNDTLMDEWENTTDYLCDLKQKRSKAGKASAKAKQKRNKCSTHVQHNSTPPQQEVNTIQLSSSSSSSSSTETIEPEFSVIEAAKAVSVELRVAGEKNLSMLRDVIQNEITVHPDWNPQQVAESLIETWQNYEGLPQVRSPAPGFFIWPTPAFFSSGIWRQPNRWLNGDKSMEAKVGGR